MTETSGRRRLVLAAVVALVAAGAAVALSASWGKRASRYGDQPLTPPTTQAGPNVQLTGSQLRAAAMTVSSPQVSLGRGDSIGPWTAAAPAPASTSAPGCADLLALIGSAAPATSTLDAPYRTEADDRKPVTGRLEISAYAPGQAGAFFAKVKAEVPACPKFVTSNATSFAVSQVPAFPGTGDDSVSFDLVGKGLKGTVEYRYDYVRAGSATVLLVEDGRLDLEQMPRYLQWFQASNLEIAQMG